MTSLPTSPAVLRPAFKTADGLAIRCAESRRAGAETILMLNPWPESLYAWETSWPRLAEVADLIAIDLPGFGGSERRDALLGPEAMGGFLVRLMDEWAIEDPHIVGFDVGSAAALFAATLVPGRVRSLVVGSGATVVPLQLGGSLRDLVEAPDVEQLRALDPRDLVAGALESIERHTLSDEAREDYLSSYEGDRFVASAAYVRSYARDLPILAERLPTLRTPTQVISGAHDPWVPPVNAEHLHDVLPASRLDLLDTGHFVWEDAADEVTTLVTDWITGGYRAVGA